MTAKTTSPVAKDALSNAVKTFSELSVKFPHKTRKELLREVALKYDLSPLECDFLEKHFSSAN